MRTERSGKECSETKVHLTAKGYQAWAEALMPLLNREGLSFPGFLSALPLLLWSGLVSVCGKGRFQRSISVSRNSSR
mgnify:CR=1 FL=1